MMQLHLQNTFDLRHQSELTNKGKAEVLEYHMFIKHKRDVKIKGRTVAEGNIQC